MKDGTQKVVQRREQSCMWLFSKGLRAIGGIPYERAPTRGLGSNSCPQQYLRQI
jgi:hypothetical protein